MWNKVDIICTLVYKKCLRIFQALKALQWCHCFAAMQHESWSCGGEFWEVKVICNQW